MASEGDWFHYILSRGIRVKMAKYKWMPHCLDFYLTKCGKVQGVKILFQETEMVFLCINKHKLWTISRISLNINSGIIVAYCCLTLKDKSWESSGSVSQSLKLSFPSVDSTDCLPPEYLMMSIYSKTGVELNNSGQCRLRLREMKGGSFNQDSWLNA